MGQMIDGAWHRGDVAPATGDGAFARKPTVFHDIIAPGTRFAPAAGRYHLTVSLACPWAHRTPIFRKLKGLDDKISVSVTHWLMGEDGWNFAAGEGVVPDPGGAAFLLEIYARADPDYTGRVTVPVLWDTQEKIIVNNESAEIIRIFNEAFDGIGARKGDYYPPALRADIDAVNARVYATLNNGVYRAGFARTQQAYDAAVVPLFETLDWLETRLASQPMLCGNHVTEADIRLFTTLVRFDSVYHGHFKCNLRRIVDYPNLWDYTRALAQIPGIADTINLDHIKRHYYGSHLQVNPTGIVPIGPALDFMAPAMRVAALPG